jgi:hypothetical protein
MADTSWQVLEGALTVVLKDAKGDTKSVQAIRAQVSQGGAALLTAQDGKQMIVAPAHWIDIRK